MHFSALDDSQLKKTFLYGQPEMHMRQPRQRSWSARTMPSSSRLYMAPDGQEATQAGLMQWLQMRGRYMWKVFSNCLNISFSMLEKFLSLARLWNSPARSSSQFGPQVILSIFSPVSWE